MMNYYNESNRLHRYLDPILKDENEEKVSDLLSFSEKYLNLATLQRERLKTFENLRNSMDDGRVTNPEHLKAIRLYFGDIHFFFNSVHKFLLFIQRLMIRIDMKPSTEFITIERHYRTIRNHFEHVDERIDKHPLYRSDFSSASSNYISIGGVDYDFSEEALPSLYSIYDEIIIALDIMIEPRKEKVDRFMKGFEQNMWNITED